MKNKTMLLFSIALVIGLLLSACTSPAPTKETGKGEVPVKSEPVTIRWFIGLGAGGNPEEVEKEEAFVKKFNEKYGDKYLLVLDIVQNETAYDVLKTQIASGEVPDIVGPAGVSALMSFKDSWLDLKPYIEKNQYDLSDFNPELIKFYQFESEGQYGIPFAVYPSALWYNVDLFDEAGLAYPPHKYGDAYADGSKWDFDKLRELSMKLTFDADGNTPESPDFDPTKIQQFGYDATWADLRGQWVFMKAGNFVAEDNKTAMLPDDWRIAAHWYYDGMWKDFFIPNSDYVNSDFLGQGNTFGSGHVAMTPINSWYTCCSEDVKWDLAAIPEYKGSHTAKLNADTFGILKGVKNPDAAFEVLTIMLGEMAPDLLSLYGAFPARMNLQESALADMQQKFPNADLQVFIESISYPDKPSHEAWMPNFLKATDRYEAFHSLYQTTKGLDLDAELDKMVVDLQAIFNEN